VFLKVLGASVDEQLLNSDWLAIRRTEACSWVLRAILGPAFLL
jgi:hypothetical protein